jgi:uncharacterized protein (TIGR03435 family)
MAVVMSAQDGPKFEVASIKPCSGEPAGRGGVKSAGRGGGSSPGRLVLHCQTVRSLVQQAYDFYANGRRLPVLPPNFRAEPISGGPSWVDSERYEINAKAEGSPRTETMNGPMLQALLEDRFKLRAHRETREVPVYLLTVAKGGIKLQKVDEGSCVPLDMDRVQAVLEQGERGRISAEPEGSEERARRGRWRRGRTASRISRGCWGACWIGR